MWITALVTVVALFCTLPFLFVRFRPWLMTYYFTKHCAPFVLERDTSQLVSATEIPTRGSTLQRNFGPETLTPQLQRTSSIRIVSLNIEMGRQLDAIIQQLQILDPHIVLLQEVDIGVPRTRKLDTGAQIAKALGMNYFFACELEDPCRVGSNSKDAGEASAHGSCGGCEGNAILSKFPILRTRTLQIRCQQLLPPTRSHSRYKTHCEAVAVVETPFGEMICYSVHLDANHTGVRGRIRQYLEILEYVAALAISPYIGVSLIFVAVLRVVCHFVTNPD